MTTLLGTIPYFFRNAPWYSLKYLREPYKYYSTTPLVPWFVIFIFIFKLKNAHHNFIKFCPTLFPIEYLVSLINTSHYRSEMGLQNPHKIKSVCHSIT